MRRPRGLEVFDPWRLVIVEFKHVIDEGRDVAAWEAALQATAIGIGELHNAHGELYMTNRGQLFGISVIHPACFFEGRTFDEAITAIVQEKRSRPMLLPGQDRVELYGEEFLQGDAEVVGPTSPEWL